MLKRPWLVQRCELASRKLRYDYMGSSEFEFGDQARSLKRIFAADLFQGATTVKVGNKAMVIELVAAKGFKVAEYQPYLQLMADDALRLKELSYFDEAVKAEAGLTKLSQYHARINVWFDIENDVLWTLSQDDLKALVVVLEDIKLAWSENPIGIRK